MDADKFYDLALNFSRDKLLRALLPPLVAPRIFRLFVSPSQCSYDTIVYWALNNAGRSQMGFFTMIYKQFVGICKALKAFWQE